MASRSAGDGAVSAARERLGARSVALVGLMGAGKTTVGRKLAHVLGLPFADTDAAIEEAARMSVSEIFAAYGEPEFRALEARVVARLAEDGPQVIATGGGAFMSEATRAVLTGRAVTVWLNADLDVLMERVSRRPTRPLLQAADPRKVMQGLIETRYPVYATADVTVASRKVKREIIADEIVTALARLQEAGR